MFVGTKLLKKQDGSNEFVQCQIAKYVKKDVYSVSIGGGEKEEWSAEEANTGHLIYQYMNKNVAKFLDGTDDASASGKPVPGKVVDARLVEGALTFHVSFDGQVDAEDMSVDDVKAATKLYKEHIEFVENKVSAVQKASEEAIQKKKAAKSSSPKKSKKVSPPKKKSTKAPKEEQHKFFNQRIAKFFDDLDQPYAGTVKQKDDIKGEIHYFVKYDDGDSEHISRDEFDKWIKGAIHLYDKFFGSKKPKGKPKRKKSQSKDTSDSEGEKASTSRAAKKPKKTAEKEDSSDGDDDIEMEDPPQQEEISSRGRRRKAVNYKFGDDDDEDESSGEEPQESSNDDDDSMSLEEEEETGKKAQPRKRRKAASKQAPKTAKKSAVPPKKKRDKAKKEEEEEEWEDYDNESDDSLEDDFLHQEDVDDGIESEDNDAEDEETGTNGKKKKKKSGKSMSESYTPMNNPVYFRDTQKHIDKHKQYLDPCGLESTDDIISKLVGNQVDRLLGGLLPRAMETNGTLGSRSNELKLGTACSGTDAPALALTLVEEQLKLRGHHDLLRHKHLYSCEQEPFKQAYLKKNFDSILYPDICKLADDRPKDCFGQEMPVPSINMFIAGTSCKDFSMLRAKWRNDIEDRGTSGETFLAAVEYMMTKKPEYCILENVQGAPWAKMAEYIEGVIKLSTCDDDKAIKKGTSEVGKKSNIKDLSFVWDETSEEIIVDAVPSNLGVRCGVAVDGYLKADEHVSTHTPRSVRWPQNIKKAKKCTLEDIMKENKIEKKNDYLVFAQPERYYTTLVEVDTKEFGLPQTRMRKYLFVSKDPGLGEYWKAIVRHLESPVRHSLEAFILRPDHEIIRHFREQLRGPAGRTTKRAAFMEPDFWASTNANLPHNKTARQKGGMEDRHRTLTEWGPHGQKQVPPHYWLEILNCNSQREMDALEVHHISSARDAESHDSSFVSYTWNISQNVTREKHRMATPGIAGCVTPGGEVFLPALGRSLLGCEKLLIQGIPYYRLLLGTETEVQLGDLAGNAMSLTVVCATILAAMCCGQLRDEAEKEFRANPGKLKGEDPFNPRFELMKTKTKKTEAMKIVQGILNESIIERKPSLPKSIDRLGTSSVDQTKFDTLVRDLSALADDAEKSSVLCTCETSGQISTTQHFLVCSVCKVSCCRNCCDSTAGYQLKSHTCEEVTICSRDTGAFEDRLRNVLPPSLAFGSKALSDISKPEGKSHDPQLLENQQFTLSKIGRERRYWTIVYFAREEGQGQPLGEFRIRIGDLSRLHGADNKELGVLFQLTSFLPAQFEPRVYGSLPPIIQYKSTTGSWKTKKSQKTCNLRVVGSDPMESFRKEVGLTDAAKEGVEASTRTNNKNPFQKAKQNHEERRWLYAKNWKEWPRILNVSSEKEVEGDVEGTYERVDCRQTFNQGAMWIRQGNSDPRYLYLRPNVSRTGPDVACISTSMDHDDIPAVVCEFPKYWQPCDALDPKRHVVKGATAHTYQAPKVVNLVFPESQVTVSSPQQGVSNTTLLQFDGLAQTELEMLAVNAKDTEIEHVVTLDMTKGQKAQQQTKAFNAICVSKMLKYAASSGIGYDLRSSAAWIPIKSNDVPFGTSTKIDPDPPVEEWRKDKERGVWYRVYRQEESRAFHQALKDCPRAFNFELNKKLGSLEVILHPRVVGHHASRNLVKGRGLDLEKESLEVSVRMSAAQFQSDPDLLSFSVPPCTDLVETDVQLKTGYNLYDRQKKVITKMAAIENRETVYDETEMYEEYMPGSAGWSIVGMAKRRSAIAGGVIADAIGAGKTVVSIGLILRGLEEARANRQVVYKDEKGQHIGAKSGATLVVVPDQLIKQWEGELRKFTSGLSVITIYNKGNLSAYSVKQIVEADCVICPIDILESDKGSYISNLMTKSKTKKDDKTPTLPQHVGQKEILGAKGTLMPNTSADPYGGNASDKAQSRRDESAWFTHCYQEAIDGIRKIEFSENDRGIPLEYFVWERVIIDEVHESLCTTKVEVDQSKKNEQFKNFKEKNRRAGRELLGIITRDPRRRPLRFTKAIFGLTGTPLLDSPNRVTELASLMGNVYVLGLNSHWRKLERESCRDIFLHYLLEPPQSREVRRMLYQKCQEYIETACCRNKVESELNGVELKKRIKKVQMSVEEGELYLKSQSGIPQKSFAIRPEDFDRNAGHNINRFLEQNAALKSRKQALVDICNDILRKDATTKIIVFADASVGGGFAAKEALNGQGGPGCTSLDECDSPETQNTKISWYQHGDATEADRKRPRVLVLHFEQAAGLNLQSECYNMIFFTPLYRGDGGATSDPVADVSSELQAVGRVYRPGQQHPKVFVYRIVVEGPEEEECLDGYLVRRNTDKETIGMAVSSAN